MAKQNKKNKKRKKNDKTQLSATIPTLGVCNLGFVFFVFLIFCFFVFCCFVFLVFWILVVWFVVGFLKGWQNNTKVKDLDLTLCQFSHFRGCKFAFGCFTVCFGPVVPLESEHYVKTKATCRYHLRKLIGLGIQVRQLCMFMYVFKKCV